VASRSAAFEVMERSTGCFLSGIAGRSGTQLSRVGSEAGSCGYICDGKCRTPDHKVYSK